MNESQPIIQDAKGATVSHRSLAQLQQSFAALTPPPADSGRLTLIVCRRAPGIHEPLDRVRLTPEEGVPGDEWNRRSPRHPNAQLTVIRRDVAEMVAHGQPLTTSGDNLIVELDISATNLPVGTRLRVGEAVVEVTPKPHNGCQKFAQRFGADALRFVQTPATRQHNLRGIYWKVVSAGEASVGAQIQVLSRPASEQRPEA
jgi:MOSC domain-containing protein YiiM